MEGGIGLKQKSFNFVSQGDFPGFFIMEVNMDQYQEIIDEIVGLNLKEASQIVRSNGMKFRIVNTNGKHFFGTSDFVPDRINVRVDDNEVTEVISVG